MVRTSGRGAAGGERDAGDIGDARHGQGVAGHLLQRLVADDGGHREQVDLRVAVRQQQGDRVVVAGIAVQDDLAWHYFSTSLGTDTRGVQFGV